MSATKKVRRKSIPLLACSCKVWWAWSFLPIISTAEGKACWVWRREGPRLPRPCLLDNHAYWRSRTATYCYASCRHRCVPQWTLFFGFARNVHVLGGQHNSQLRTFVTLLRRFLKAFAILFSLNLAGFVRIIVSSTWYSRIYRRHFSGCHKNWPGIDCTISNVIGDRALV